jgi:hypothetical protein
MDTFKCFVVPCDQKADLLESKYNISIIILMENKNFHESNLQDKFDKNQLNNYMLNFWQGFLIREIYFETDSFCKKNTFC